MIEATPGEVARYVADLVGIPVESVRTEALGGGVSNHVVLAELDGCRMVIKQALAKLRVKEDWFSDINRIWRESEALLLLAPLLPEGALPEVLFEDRENFLFAMTAAPSSTSWKSELMAGRVSLAVAESIGRIHARMIEASLDSPELRDTFGDQTVFDQLRLDPYYRFTASRHPDLAPLFLSAIDRCGRERRSLVHGDWSPKNMMVDGDSVMVIDFEVIHFGDPSFDTAFLLNHLLLKSFAMPHLRAELAEAAARYWSAVSKLAPATIDHLPLLMLARIDGKSPVEYIQDGQMKERVRAFARDLIARRPESIAEVFERL
ncbi:MAG: phosphotransferase [Bryobacteraceae bacterium]